MTSDAPTPDPLEALALAELAGQCRDALDRFRRTGARSTDSRSCAEIVRRAARHDQDALGVMIRDISYPRIEEWCRSKLRSFGLTPQDVEDVQQEVANRLVRRFGRGQTPYNPGTLAEYYAFLLLTTRRLIIDMQAERRTSAAASLDYLQEEKGYEPSDPTFADEVERRMRFERFLELLPDTQMRDVFQRRLGLDESASEVAQALGIEKGEVYRLTERAVRILAANPEVRDMLGE